MVGDFFSKESGILLIGSVYLHVCKLPQTANGLQVSKAEQISKCEAKAGPACWLCARHAPVYSFICLCLCHFGQHRQNLPCHLQFCLTFLHLRVCVFCFLSILQLHRSLNDSERDDSCRGGLIFWWTPYGSLWGLMVIPPVQPVHDVHKPCNWVDDHREAIGV